MILEYFIIQYLIWLKYDGVNENYLMSSWWYFLEQHFFINSSVIIQSLMDNYYDFDTYKGQYMYVIEVVGVIIDI